MREWTIDELHEAYDTGTTSPAAVCEEYLDRISRVDAGGPAINAVIEVNPQALEIAGECGDRRVGLLHGVPVLLKDNIDTGDRMQTTAGSLALAGVSAPRDAFLVERLRAEGAIILGKTNLSEWANFRSPNSNSGWSSRGGQTRNPYVLDRNPSGSSSGSAAAIAANLAVVAVGTETDGSITSPAAHTSLVGVKPTLGTVSRTGIIPIAASQDTAGPMARTVRDAALLLQALAGRDELDAATVAATDYLAHLDPGFLAGKRIGVARNCADVHRGTVAPFKAALAAIEAAGATLVDPTDLPDFGPMREHELTVLLFEFRHGLAAYFARRFGTAAGSGAAGSAAAGDVRRGESGPRTIDEVISFNEEHADEVLRYFGHEHMVAAAASGPLTDERYREALRESRRLAGPDGLEALFEAHRLDALVAPTNGPAWLIDHVNGDYYTGGRMSSAPAISGAPHITLPMGYYHGLPLGLSLVGRFGDDARLLGIAYAFEQATRVRRPPQFKKTVEYGKRP